MPYKLKTQCYRNGVFFGSPILYAPNYNAPSVNFTYEGRTWAVATRTCQDNGFTCFKIPYKTYGDNKTAPVDLANVSGEKYPLEVILEGENDDVYDYYIQSNDGHQRILRVTNKWVQSSEPSIETIRMHNWLSFEYIKDGVSLLTLESGSAAMGYYNYTLDETEISHSEDFGCIPWIGKINGSDELITSDGTAYYTTTISNPGNPTNIGVSFTGTTKSSSLLRSFRQWLGDWTPEDTDGDDPYPDPDDDDDSDDPQPDPLPGISAVGTGFATIFRPSLAQLRNLSGLFWNETIFDFFQNLVENISDMFLSLAMVPFTVPAGATVSVTWLGIDTAVSLTLAAQQFIEFNMGSIDLSSDSRIWRSGSALDYSPFSQLGIYLPFIGFRDLDIDDCRDKTINLRYRMDILSGECVAIITLNGATYYQFSGNCLSQIPITNEGMQALVSDAVQVGLSVAAVASAGGGAAAAEGAAQEGGVKNALDKLDHMTSTPQGRQLASTTANAVIGGKPMYGKTGSVSGAGGMLAVRQPYLYLKTPVSAIPNYYRRYCGYPCNRTATLGSFSGYTVVEDIRLNNLVATSSEVAEIYELLKGGVII